jgi:hypothetical protein
MQGRSRLLVTVDRLGEILRRSYGVREVRGSPAARNRKAEQDTSGSPRA